MCLRYKSFENTVGKEEIAPNNLFSFSHSVFYLFGEFSAIFNKFEIVVCKLFLVWKGLKFVVWERVKCFKCVKRGHRGKDCKNVNSTENHRKIYCWRCGQEGHILTFCWQNENRETKRRTTDDGHSTIKQPLQETDFPPYVMARLSLVLSGPYPIRLSRNEYVVALVDWYSGWPEAFSVPDIYLSTYSITATL